MISCRLWPHESHTCKLKFGSWTGHGGQIQLGLYDDQDTVEDLKFYTDNKEWQLVRSEASKNNNTYPGIEQYYPDITFTFHLQLSSCCYGSLCLQDWVLVAAGIERFCFFVYTMAFALVTSVYI